MSFFNPACKRSALARQELGGSCIKDPLQPASLALGRSSAVLARSMATSCGQILFREAKVTLKERLLAFF